MSNPESSRTHLKVADLLETSGRLPEAETHYREAVRLATTPTHRRDAREGLATFLGSHGRLDEADQLFSAVVAEAPNRATSWAGLGNIALLRGANRLAAQHYGRALAVAPGHVEAAFNLSLALQALGDLEGAARARARARELGVGVR